MCRHLVADDFEIGQRASVRAADRTVRTPQLAPSMLAYSATCWSVGDHDTLYDEARDCEVNFLRDGWGECRSRWNWRYRCRFAVVADNQAAIPQRYLWIVNDRRWRVIA